MWRDEIDRRPIYQDWENLYKDDSKLAGVVFIYEGEQEFGHIGKHPPGVMYVFWDGTIRQTSHDPDGRLKSSFDWSIGQTSGYWDSVRYELGSDPDFRFHKDPRS